ncbi:tRNA-dihydrouridine(47) synthase [NAD(P)(+)]-like [Physella acuta]|uniref:tRNA-dihydrouridine(47) synthase [NAD(P)(+)]-like n=1 Tax=Physella acuta TaxID=109671 RepID=UPI0027DCB203|nr:tRNA-dihydrouridine(47) synthase [NAD(P)(+)]-like [Physella acuta]
MDESSTLENSTNTGSVATPPSFTNDDEIKADEPNEILPNTCKKISGYAPIKQEYLVPDHKPTLHSEYLSVEVKEKLEKKILVEEDNSDKEEAEPPTKKAKLKGRNKNRPRNERIQSKDRICPAIKENKECRFGEKCIFNHSKEDFVKNKLSELEGPCFLFDTFGYCHFGIACRFAKNHLSKDLENVVNQELYDKMKHVKTLNELTREIRQKLWKKKYNFSRANSIVKEIEKCFRGWDKGKSDKVNECVDCTRQAPKDILVPVQDGGDRTVSSDVCLSSGLEKTVSPDVSLSSGLEKTVSPDVCLSAGLEKTASPDVSLSSGLEKTVSPDVCLSAGLEKTASPDVCLSSGLEKTASPDVSLSSGLEKTASPDVCLSSGLEKTASPDVCLSSDLGNADKTAEMCVTLPKTESKELPKTLGCVTDEDIVPLRSQEKAKIDFKNKLYLAPLTTVGNLPFRRVCKEFGADITCGEMALVTQLLKGKQSEWSLMKRHASEDIFGVQICGSYPDTMTRCAQLLTETCDVDFIDINCGCPIDLIYRKGGGSALMSKATKLEQICRSMVGVMNGTPLTVKLRTGVFDGKNVAHQIIPRLRNAGVSLVTVHGRSREQRYTKLADWSYVAECASAGAPMPVFGNGDILSFEDANIHMQQTGVSGVMIARGALVKPWIFTEIKEQRHWDISSGERFDILKTFTNYGLEHWGSDHQGVENTRRFLLEWLSFLYRYIPVGVLEVVPQRINERPPYYIGRNDLETLMASANCADWIKISEMLLGPVPPNFHFLPKHKANAYQ